MEQGKKVIIYKRVFFISTLSGFIGIYCFYKEFIVIGWILIGIWAILAIFVRVLIILDKKSIKIQKM